MTAGGPDIATFRFLRSDVLGRSGLATWREIIGRTILKLDLALLPEFPFHSEAWTRALPGLRLAFATKSGLRMARTRALLADGTDDLALHICTAGTWTVSHRGREVSLGPGEAVLVSDAEVASVTCQSLARCTCLQLPRTALVPFVSNPDDAVMRTIPADSEPLRLLVNYASMLGPDQALTAPALQRLVVGHIRDLVATVLDATGDAAGLAEAGGIGAARLHAIKTDITRRLASHDLSVTAVAGRHGVSPRYVQALFEREGTTFSAFVRGQRLARAHQLLDDPHRLRTQIGEIAFEVGFSDLSHFNRDFRRRYGVTPSDVRAAAQ
jgi:AraC-like DNA-binding protein